MGDPREHRQPALTSIVTGTPLVIMSKTAERARDCSTSASSFSAGALPFTSKPTRMAANPLRTSGFEPEDAVQVDVALHGRGDLGQLDAAGGGDVGEAGGEAAGEPVQHVLDGRRAVVRPTSTFGWSTSRVVGCSWARSSPTPKKSSMVLWLWVPDIHRFEARNWNWAAAGASFTASRVANRVVVSTPLRTPLGSGWSWDGSFVVVVVVVGGWGSGRGGGGLAALGQERALREPRRFVVDQDGEALLQLDEAVDRRELRHLPGHLEDRGQGVVPLGL